MTERTLQRERWLASRDRHITGERRRSAALESAAHLGVSSAPIVALAAVSDAVAITDRGGAILYANPAWAELAGYADDTQALLGCPVTELLEPKTSVRAILEGLRHAPRFTATYGLRHAAGYVVPVEVDVSRCVDVEPHTSRFVIVARPRKSTAPGTALAGSVLDTVGRLAAELAHDFNNQISVVLNYSFILLRQLKADDAATAHLAQMQTSARRASLLAQEMLGFGGRRLTDPEALDLGQVASAMKPLLRQSGGETCAEVALRVAPALPRVRARLPHIEWMLLELTLHARRMVGQVERFELDVTSETGPRGEPEVVVQLRAAAASDPAARRPSLAARVLPEDAGAMPGVELALMHTRAELTTTHAQEHVISYRVRFPAEPS